ncbi:PIN2/TERF1-interacting telomerase inhibitor 1-like [Maniola hyperantus]|uniref:PIN2/TERF1-interacting telomerase inhibitor 1-like n=1 Tax=Aphantopus hyperantus TaxID=2795564 RepID=UPI0015693176|nr:PIN2/TERF1-interacting telomerase inhibitor 1-like [Maniola hyperantus]
MSMLAEPRRKQKVINLRAKNNAWSNDSTKFGQRMLEKMGWSSGKGLGAKENGIVEHVVARYKNDEKGLGFEDRNDQWTKHEDDFNSLLANLSNADGGMETLHSGISLEKKSKKSKARIHYHKFTRGKDLSRYSEKDLANIFGKKSFKEREVKEHIKEDTLQTTEQVFTEKGNMDDYFKTKLAAFKSKLTDTNTKNEEVDYTFKGFSNTAVPENNQNGSVSTSHQPFSFYSSQKEDITQNIELPCPDLETKSKKKKKSKPKEISCQVAIERNNLPESIQEIVMGIGTIKAKKSKNKLHTECIEKTQSLDKVDKSDSAGCLQGTIVMDVESTKVKKPKKNKHKECIAETQSSHNVEESNSSECIQDIAPKKNSRKKKYQECVDDENRPCEEISKVKKKNKNKRHVEDIQEQISIEDHVPKKKKKSKNQGL